jgi:hypothetical protein
MRRASHVRFWRKSIPDNPNHCKTLRRPCGRNRERQVEHIWERRVRM